MPVVKKTVAIHPLMDDFVRKMWAILIEAGYDASYSTALNYMLLGQIRLIQEKGIPKEVSQDLNSFLNDEESISDLNLEDFANKVDELVERRNKSRSLK